MKTKCYKYENSFEDVYEASSFCDDAEYDNDVKENMVNESNDEQVSLKRQGIHSEASAFKDMSMRMKIMAIGVKVDDLFALEEISNCFLIMVIPGLH